LQKIEFTIFKSILFNIHISHFHHLLFQCNTKSSANILITFRVKFFQIQQSIRIVSESFLGQFWYGWHRKLRIDWYVYVYDSNIKMISLLKLMPYHQRNQHYYFLDSNVIIFRNQVVHSILGLVDVWIIFRDQCDCPAKSTDSYDE